MSHIVALVHSLQSHCEEVVKDTYMKLKIPSENANPSYDF
jgi:hypothetical protein